MMNFIELLPNTSKGSSREGGLVGEITLPDLAGYSCRRFGLILPFAKSVSVHSRDFQADLKLPA